MFEIALLSDFCIKGFCLSQQFYMNSLPSNLVHKHISWTGAAAFSVFCRGFPILNRREMNGTGKRSWIHINCFQQVFIKWLRKMKKKKIESNFKKIKFSNSQWKFLLDPKPKKVIATKFYIKRKQDICFACIYILCPFKRLTVKIS